MDKKTRNLIIIGSIITFIIVPVTAALLFSHLQPKHEPAVPQPQTAKLPPRSNDELIKAITDATPALENDGQPTIAVVKTVQPENGWYVVTIRQLDDPEGLNPAKVLLHDTGKEAGLQLLLGPGTDFPKNVTDPLHLPDKVLTELNA